MSDLRTYDQISKLLQVLEATAERGVLLEAIDVLRTLSRSTNDHGGKNKVYIGRKGLPVIIAKLKTKDLKVKQTVGRLLRSITVNELNQEKFGREGAIELILDLLSGSHNYDLLLSLSAVLWNISVNDENKRKIVQEGGTAVLITLMKSEDERLQNEACGCMRNLCLDEENKKIIGKEGAIPILLNLLDSSVDSIQKNSAMALKNLSSNNERNMRRIEREGGNELLMHVLTKRGLDKNSKSVSSIFMNGLHSDDTLRWEDITLITKIGEGKYGDVYKGKYHGFPVACKIIKKKNYKKKTQKHHWRS